jgi:hypothetical protein
MHVIGASGTGKSKFLESLICQDILNRRGLCLIDPHGTLAQSVLAYVSRQIYPPKNFYYIQPSGDDWTCVYNPLNRRTADEWFLINALKLAVLKCWGQDSSLDTPRLDEWLTNTLYTGVNLQLTLPDLAMLLEPGVERNVQRRAIIERLPESASGIRAAWEHLCTLADKKPVDFEATVGAAKRRLARFVDNPRLTRMYGVPGVTLDLAAMMDEGAVLIVDLSPAGRFYAEDAQLFGTLLLTDFYCQMFSRTKPKLGFSLYIDEFQNYATKDIARMLDEARKFGLRLCLSHQRPGQLQNSDSAEERDIYSAVMTNARNKVVFGGIDPQELEPIAKLLTISTLDPYKVKREIWTRGVVDYAKEYWQAHSRTTSRSWSSTSGGSTGMSSTAMWGHGGASGATYDPNSGPISGQRLFTSESNAWNTSYGSSESSGSSWADSEGESDSEGVTEFPVLVPVLGEQLSSVYYETPEEQLLQVMAILYDQQQRQAMAKLAGQKEPVPIETPFIETPPASAEQIRRQLEVGYHPAPWFLPVAEAAELVRQRAVDLLALGLPRIEPRQATVERGILEVSPSTSSPMISSSSFPIRIGGVELQPRDVALLGDVFENRFISIKHAAALHWPGLSAGDAAAKRRLAKLAEAGLLQQQQVEIEGCRVIYRLTKESVDLLAERELIPRIVRTDWSDKMRKRYTDELRPSHLAHELSLYDLKVAFTSAVNQHAHIRIGELGIWPLPYAFPVTRKGRVTKQLPDGFLRIDEHRPSDDGVPISHYFYLELDNGGNEKLDTLAEKAEGYRSHLRSGAFATALGADANATFRVLVVVAAQASAARRDNICARIGALGIHTLVWAATMQEVLAGPLESVWITPKALAENLATPAKLPLLDDLSTQGLSGSSCP